MNHNTSKWLVPALIIALVGCVCLTVVCIGAAGVVLFTSGNSVISRITPEFQVTLEFNPTPTESARPTPRATPTPRAGQPPAADLAAETLRTLEESVAPINDPVALAERFKGITGIAPTLPAPNPPPQIGDKETFWASNSDTDEKFQVDAILRYETPHVYFWIEDGVKYNKNDLQRLVDTFEEKIYPTNRKFFGSEWSPGIDDDVHLYVLYARGMGSSVAGYFSSVDSVPPAAFEFSNGHEMFVLNADTVDLGEDYIYGTMAHEFQHMIHWYRDRNEESWLNEGFSELAQLLNGYDQGGFDGLFLSDPDLQLNTWPDPEQAAPHYGASSLFTAYFLGRFGDQATQAVVGHVENGLDSIDIVLKELGLTNPDTGAPLSADDVFTDWTVSNYLDQGEVPGGRFDYPVYPGAPKASATEEFSDCPVDPQDRTVSQYGSDYIRFTCKGQYTLSFQGSTEAPLLAERPYSGDYAFWSNKGDESDQTLTQTFDLSGVSGPVSLAFRTWYDIEKDWDYVYLLASTDGGNTWEFITTPSGTDTNPTGNSYGWGYTGQTQNWIREEVDLSKYAGKQVTLRFEYVTDAAVNGEGMLIDDIQIEAIGYRSDLEKDSGGWEAKGFVRVASLLPQSFRLTLITRGGETRVIPVTLDAQNRAEIPLEIGGDVDEAILVVSGTTRFTIQPASYTFGVK